MRVGASPFVLSPWRSGHLRFPSGALVPYDCGDSTGAIVVEEPQWLSMMHQGQMVRLRLTDDAPDQRVRVWVEPANEFIEPEERDDGLYVRIPQGSSRMMLKFGERWLSRYYPL